ncbi:PTS glucose transporter subunit IIA [Lactobacillus amylovorus]|uniref:PTS sugar transporter subunit IIA n=2 Tax=Lactobacillus amylovorus TaxID=1604 RepID=UPI0028890277|nr:PTS glucose transporter subunit IIA [Lactobacillus amylovorus]MCT3596460.1 PTS glucose transporter subunit IIA [Lactobacillus amylovorus]
MIAKTKHAIGITTKNGTKILIHMGLDTVDLNGLPFDVKVKEGQEVKKGQLLVDMNIEMIKKNGKDPTVIVVLTQPDKILNNKTYNVANRNTPIGKIGNAAN